MLILCRNLSLHNALFTSAPVSNVHYKLVLKTISLEKPVMNSN